MMKLLKNLFFGSLVLTFVFPAHVFAGSPAQSEELQKMKNQVVALAQKGGDSVRYYTDAKKTKELAIEDVAGKVPNEIFAVVNVEETQEKQMGLHLKFGTIGMQDGVLKSRVTFRTTDATFEKTYDARSIELNSDQPEDFQVALSQSIHSAVNSTLQQMTSVKSQPKTLISKVVNTLFPSAQARGDVGERKLFAIYAVVIGFGLAAHLVDVVEKLPETSKMSKVIILSVSAILAIFGGYLVAIWILDD
jgi:hypothetical protein